MKQTVDSFAHDPHVQILRQLFADIEKAQSALLAHAGISPLDGRLRTIRNDALRLFERSWRTAMKRGILHTDGDGSILYLHCFAKALTARGLALPPEALTQRQDMEAILSEVLS